MPRYCFGKRYTVQTSSVPKVALLDTASEVKHPWRWSSRRSGRRPPHPGRHFVTIVVYFYGGQAFLRGGARIESSIGLHFVPALDPPPRERQVRAHILLVRTHKSSMFQKPVIFWGPGHRALRPPNYRLLKHRRLVASHH